jgi:hypothetical protein
MDPAGRGMIFIGMILGVTGLVLNLGFLIHQCSRS